MVQKNLNLLFFGSSEFAVQTLVHVLNQSTHLNLMGVVCVPDRPSGRGMKLHAPPVKSLTLERGIPLYQPESLSAFRDNLNRLAPDIGLVVAYGKILPQWCFDSYFPHGLYNIHASLLPAFRGASPIRAVLKADVPNTGLCIQQMVYELDAGPVWISKSVSIPPSMDFGQLYSALNNCIPDVTGQFMAEAPPQLSDLTVQSADHASYCGKDQPSDSHMILERPETCRWIHLRAFLPTPGIWIMRSKERLIKLCKGTYLEKTQCTVGLILKGQVLMLSTEDGHLIRVDEVQLPGKPKVAVQNWINGYHQLIRTWCSEGVIHEAHE